jgi:serine palmitoyltransferase
MVKPSLLKSRLGRLWGLKSSKFRKNLASASSLSEARKVSIDQISTSSSVTTSDTSSDDDESCTNATAMPTRNNTNSHHSTKSRSSNRNDYGNFYPSGVDPYADVRDRLEELSRRDRIRFSTGTNEMVHTPTIPVILAYCVYFSLSVIILIGHIRDFFAMVFQRGRYIRKGTGFPSDVVANYAPLLKSFDTFYNRRMFSRIGDVLNRPVASNPGAVLTVLERVSDNGFKSLKVLGPLSNLDSDQQRKEYSEGEHYTLSHDGRVARKCVNLGSYNYLGFADDWNALCAKDVNGSLQDYSVSVGSSRVEYGTTALHRELERTIATFLGKEDALVLNMGFNTNATTIPALVQQGDLILSDSLNHTSIVSGARGSGAAIRTFRHNDMKNLESILREAVVMGRPRTRRPWNKILVIVEGIYSMEGEYCDLRNVVRLCKKYGAYVYLDEAHSIGAMGPTGRGISEFTGTDTSDIDIMMGTFTKSFGGMGGYIAADKATIEYLRQRCSGSAFHNALSPVVCQQVLTCFKIISGQDGSTVGRTKLLTLRDNANYFRMRLREMGLEVLGQYDSPVIPVMLYVPAKIAGFMRECFKRGLAVVVVGFPAVPLTMSRVRFCVSAGHTRDYLDRALKEIAEVATVLQLRYQPNNPDLVE